MRSETRGSEETQRNSACQILHCVPSSPWAQHTQGEPRGDHALGAAAIVNDGDWRCVHRVLIRTRNDDETRAQA